MVNFNKEELAKIAYEGEYEVFFDPEKIFSFSNKLLVEQPIVVICHSGVRSWHFAMWLISQNSNYKVWNLDGGIDAWSVEVDPTVPRY